MPVTGVVTIGHKKGVVTLVGQGVYSLLFGAVKARRTGRLLKDVLFDNRCPSDVVTAIEKENEGEDNHWLFEHIYAIAEGREQPTTLTPRPFQRMVNDAWAAAFFS